MVRRALGDRHPPFVRLLTIGTFAWFVALLVGCGQDRPDFQPAPGGVGTPFSDTQPWEVIGATDTLGGDDVAASGQDVAGNNVDVSPQPKDVAAVTGPPCEKNSDCAKHKDTPMCLVTQGVCVECIVDFQCTQKKAGTACENYSCAEIACKPGSTWCKTGFVATCNKSGKGFELASCPDAKPVCIKGVCGFCEPSQRFCQAPPAGGKSIRVLQCNKAGTDADVYKTCAKGNECIAGACKACVPGIKKCIGSKAVQCRPDGSALDVVKDCANADQGCLAGVCVNPCSGDLKSNTHAGCRYWAVDLDNAVHKSGGQTFDAQNMQFAVIVSNTVGVSTGVTANVKVRLGKHVATHQVKPGFLAALKLPDPAWKLTGTSLDGTEIADKAFEISSNVPIIAYQFNPLENFGVFSNDASLLLPEHVLGQHYYVMTRRQNFIAHPSYLTVVGAGTQGKSVNVTVQVTAPTMAAKNVPALKKGQTFKLSLAPGRVFNLETAAIGADLTGSRVDADGPIAVFAGSEAANVPDTNNCLKGAGQPIGKCENGGWACKTIADCPVTCCADHIEQQLFPVSSWGKTYVATKLKKRGLEPDVWRVMAANNGTNITTKPPQGSKLVLNAGEFFEFASKADFTIAADKPILVGQFMASANAPDPNNDLCTAQQLGQKVCATYLAKTGKGLACQKHTDCPNVPQQQDAKIGDPAFILAVAEERWLSHYVFLTPDKYKHSYVNIVRAKGVAVALDGKSVGAGKFSGVPGSQFDVARLALNPGGHVIAATQPVGVVVYGWDEFVSYGYPAGAGF